MVNSFASWLFNIILLGGIVAIAGLFYHVFAAPILYDGIIALAALGVVVVVALFWPKY